MNWGLVSELKIYKKIIKVTATKYLDVTSVHPPTYNFKQAQFAQKEMHLQKVSADIFFILQKQQKLVSLNIHFCRHCFKLQKCSCLETVTPYAQKD